VPRVYVEVENLKDIIKELAAMPEKGKDVLHEAVNQGAEYLQPKIRNRVPLSSEDDVHLKDHIKISKAKRKKTIKQTALVRISGKNADYGFHVETGHLTQAGRHIPANPFMRSATDENAEKVAEIAVEHILKRMGV
jgi:HK97 gp10 family phage protein